jgi:hypothetical protein
MQFAAIQEQMERVTPEWCTANGFGEDPVMVSTFTELAVRLLSTLPSEPSQGTSLGLDLCLADECLLEKRVNDDSVTQSSFRPYVKGETLRTQRKGLPVATPADPSPSAEPANTAYGQSPPVKWMPDCSGDWRPLLHSDGWWVAGHYMMYPAMNETDAERLCQELVSQD